MNLVDSSNTFATGVNYFYFPSPINVTSDYSIGIDFSAMGDDTIGIVSTTDGDAGSTELTWELQSDGNWYSMLYSWPLDFDMAIFAIIETTPPANDDCTGAITLLQTTTCTPTNGTTVGATESLAAITCGTALGYADDDVWYKFVANTVNPTIEVTGLSGFDAVVDLRSGACNGTNIACADLLYNGTETINATGLTIGATYYVRVYDYDLASPGTFTICVHDAAAPITNDDCTGAITLTQAATCTPTNGTTAGATQSIAAITCNADIGTADDDVWFKFVANTVNPIIEVTGSNGFDAIVDLRTGACNGTNIDCADATYNNGTEIINAAGLTIGSTYYIRVYDYGIATPEAFTICVHDAPAPPVNDDCAGAITITQAVTCTPTNGTTVGATETIAAITCGLAAGDADDDVWFKFVANTTNPIIEVAGISTFDAVIDLRSGVCDGVNIDCADDYSNGTETINATGLTIGSTYYVRVYDAATALPGTFTICVHDTTSAPLINDDCAGAILLTQTDTCTPTNGTTLGATESGATVDCGGHADDDVWFKFVANTTSPIIEVAGLAGFDAVVDLRSGACDGVNIDCADLSYSDETEYIYTFGLTVNSTYYIRVYDYGLGTPSTFTICVYDSTIITSINTSTLGIENVNVYPNPTKDLLNIEFNSSDVNNISISILNNLSQQIVIDNENNFSGSYKKSFNINSLSKGVYTLKIEAGEKTINKKVVILK